MIAYISRCLLAKTTHIAKPALPLFLPLFYPAALLRAARDNYIARSSAREREPSLAILRASRASSLRKLIKHRGDTAGKRELALSLPRVAESTQRASGAKFKAVLSALATTTTTMVAAAAFSRSRRFRGRYSTRAGNALPGVSATLSLLPFSSAHNVRVRS